MAERLTHALSPYKPFNKLIAGVAVLASCAAGGIGANIYTNDHSEFLPIDLPAGAKLLRSEDSDKEAFLVPVNSAESLSCGGIERPIAVDGHNSKNIVAEIGNQAIVQCDTQYEVPIHYSHP